MGRPESAPSPWDGFTAALVERPENMNFCRVARVQPEEDGPPRKEEGMGFEEDV